MKSIARYIIATVTITMIALYLCFSLSSAARSRHQTGCVDMQISILDSMLRNFVSEKDVDTWITRECGKCVGKRITELDLPLIERTVEKESAVKKCEAYVLRNGLLQIEVTQHKPSIKFTQGARHIYATSDGYLFPIHKNAPTDILTVDGHLPFADIAKGPASDSERAWMGSMMEMFSWISSTENLRDNVSRLHIEKNGEVTIYPRTGKTRILFGFPRDMESKFKKIGRYYTDIAQKTDVAYSSVNVKYAGQIICRK